MVVTSIWLFAAVHVHAQVTANAGQDLKDVAYKTDHGVKKSAKKSGNKTAELTAQGKTK
jgi:hypothetical protein